VGKFAGIDGIALQQPTADLSATLLFSADRLF
jgi:hypothetical protein